MFFQFQKCLVVFFLQLLSVLFIIHKHIQALLLFLLISYDLCNGLSVFGFQMINQIQPLFCL